MAESNWERAARYAGENAALAARFAILDVLPKATWRQWEPPRFAPVSHITHYMTDGSVQSFTQIEARKRPDGVWEMPE